MMVNAGTARRVVRRNRLADWADKYLFMVIFVAGACLIVLLKRMGVSQPLVILAPVTAMLTYGTYVFATPRYRLREDRAGDSLYYLGFLFTMVSLAYSLYEFGSSEGGTQSIVTNFGIALATTILGLTLRVVYQQMRQDPFDVEREVHLQLTESAEKLHAELLGAITDFNSLRTAIVQSLGEAVAETTKGMKDIISGCTTKYENSATELANAVSESAAQVRKHTAAMLGMLEDSKKSYENSATELANAVSESAAQVRKHTAAMLGMLEDSKKSYANSATELARVVNAAAASLEQHSNAVKESSDRAIHAVEGMVERIARIEVPPDILTSRIQDFVEHVEAAVQATLKRIETEQDRLSGLEKLIEKTTALTTTMTTDINSLQAEAGAQREVIRLAVATLKQTIDTVNSTVSDVAAIATKNVEEHRTQLQALEEESAAILHTVQDHREKIKSDVKISAEMLSQVQGSLVSLTRLIVEKLNGKQV